MRVTDHARVARRGSSAPQLPLRNTAFWNIYFRHLCFSFKCALIFGVLHCAEGGRYWPCVFTQAGTNTRWLTQSLVVWNKVILLWKLRARLPDIWGGFNPSSDWMASLSLIKSRRPFFFRIRVFNDEAEKIF